MTGITVRRDAEHMKQALGYFLERYVEIKKSERP
jgi:hypothetical protein